MAGSLNRGKKATKPRVHNGLLGKVDIERHGGGFIARKSGEAITNPLLNSAASGTRLSEHHCRNGRYIWGSVKRTLCILTLPQTICVRMSPLTGTFNAFKAILSSLWIQSGKLGSQEWSVLEADWPWKRFGSIDLPTITSSHNSRRGCILFFTESLMNHFTNTPAYNYKYTTRHIPYHHPLTQHKPTYRLRYSQSRNRLRHEPIVYLLGVFATSTPCYVQFNTLSALPTTAKLF